MNNIYVIIGNNGVGKTRFLIKKADESRRNNLRIVTNLREYDMYNSIETDANKMNAIDNIGNTLLDAFHTSKSKKFNNESFKILELIMMKGDVLILDEVGALIPDVNMPSLMAAIADCRKYWKEIYITGYYGIIDRVFIDTNIDDYSTTYNPNYYTVDSNSLELKYVTEDEAYEYFDSI